MNALIGSCANAAEKKSIVADMIRAKILDRVTPFSMEEYCEYVYLRRYSIALPFLAHIEETTISYRNPCTLSLRQQARTGIYTPFSLNDLCDPTFAIALL